MAQTIHTYTKTDLKIERPKHVAWSFVRILHRISSAGSTAIDPKTTRNDDPVFKSCIYTDCSTPAACTQEFSPMLILVADICIPHFLLIAPELWFLTTLHLGEVGTLHEF